MLGELRSGDDTMRRATSRSLPASAGRTYLPPVCFAALMLRLAPLALLFLVPAAVGQPSAPWQQEVAYTMDVRLEPERHRLSGRQQIAYTNQSPDTLRQVYFHLYFNAFHPESEMAAYSRRLPDPDGRTVPRIYNLGPDEIGYQRIQTLTQDGVPIAFEVVDTVLRAMLATPLLPGATTTLALAFEAQVPLQTRRSGRDSDEGIDYTMTQWYPKVAAYDARGWHAAPYLGREFYAPFGTFDVRITLPADYVVGATGVLQNPDAVGHGYDQSPDVGLTSTGPAHPDSLTWHFHAERVHDFAWTADPDYRHVRALVDDVPGRAEPVALHFLFQPDVAELWQNAAVWTAALLRRFSAEYGPYGYPQFTVAQGGDGGMEYPMFTAITGRRAPGALFQVIAHELAHQWVYGMLGTDEMAFAWMDEGFADFVEAEAVHAFFLQDGGSADHARARRDIADMQRLGLYQPPHTFANDFVTDRGYATASYDAGRALLDLLGYVVGDTVRDATLRAFADRFRFRHPTPDDFRSVAEDVSGLDLRWLFTPFLDAGARYDYSVEDLDVERTAAGYRSTVTLRRRQAGVLPVEVRLHYDDGTEALTHIPVAEAGGHRAERPSWTVAAPWPAAERTYTLTVEAPSPVREVQLDPEGRALDFDRTNDRAVRGGRDVPLRFAGFYANPRPDPSSTTWALSSITTLSHDYGVGVGAQLRSVAPGGRSRFQLGVTVWPAVLADDDRGFDAALPLDPPSGVRPLPTTRDASPFDGVDYTLNYTRAVGYGVRNEITLDAQKHLGVMEHRASFARALGPFPALRRWDRTLRLTLGHQHRVSDRAFEAFDPPSPSLLADAFGLDTYFSEAHVISGRLDYHVGQPGDEIAAFVEVGGGLGGEGDRIAPAPPSGATRLGLRAAKSVRLGAWTARADMAFGLGLDGLALQKRFGLGVGSAETQWRTPAYRVFAAAPDNPQRDANLLPFSGTGPVAYAISDPFRTGPFDLVPRRIYPPYGTRLLAGTLGLDLGPLRMPGLEPELRAALAPLRIGVFASVGALGSPSTAFFRPFLADAGLRLGYDVPAFAFRRGLIAQSDVLRSLRLRAVFPFWVSDPDLLGPDEGALGMRWLIGVETGL